MPPWIPSPAEASTVLARGRRAYVLNTLFKGREAKLAAVLVRYVEPRVADATRADGEERDDDCTPIVIYDEEWVPPAEVKPDLELGDDDEAPSR